MSHVMRKPAFGKCENKLQSRSFMLFRWFRGGLCLNHGHVESYFCVGTTIVGDFGGETNVKKRHGSFRSTAPHQHCFNKQLSLVQYILSVFLQVTKFDVLVLSDY